MDVEDGPQPLSAHLLRSCADGQRSKYQNALVPLSLRNGLVSGFIVVIIGFLLNTIFVNTTDIGDLFSTITSLSRADVNSIEAQNLSSLTTVAPHTDANISTSLDADVNDGSRENVIVEDEDWELKKFTISWGMLENYRIGNKLGEGEYSEVFHSVDLRNNKSCVAKVLKPVKKRRAKREIKILEDLSGGPNIVKLVDVARNNQSKSPSIVTEYINNTYHRTLYPTFNDTDVRFYMFQLLRAVEFAHSKSIMHRDIKPYNVMIDHENRKLRLIDWGLSDYYNEEYYYTTSVGSRYWRAPELLVDYEWYHLSSDIWSVGCMLAALIFEKEPFFRGRHNDIYQLIKIVKVLGTDDFFKWLSKYEIELDDEFDEVQGWYKKRSWGSFVDWHNRPLIGDDAFDLLSKLLVYDHNDRLTATEALAHPYFDPVREEALSHPSTVTIWNTN